MKKRKILFKIGLRDDFRFSIGNRLAILLSSFLFKNKAR